MGIELKYLLYAADIVWIFPAIRQYKTRFFFLFLMLAIDDPLGYLVYFFIYPNTYLVVITTLFLAFVSFFDKKILKKYWHIFTLIFAIMTWGYFMTDNWVNHIILTMAALTFLIMATVHIFIASLARMKFDTFVLILICYFLMQMVRYATYIFFDFQDIENFTYFFFVIDIFIGFFFIINRHESDRFLVQL